MSFESLINLPRVSAQFANGGAATTAKNVCRDLGIQRALLLGTPNAEQRYAEVWESLQSVAAAKFFRAEPHCPIDVVEKCRDVYLENHCDGVLTIGGGSTLGLGKILSAEERARFVAMPTTYSGSEMTAIFGRKVDGQKKTRVDEACRPDVVIYDAELSKGLPQYESVTIAMNSIAHAAEALYAKNRNRLAATLARDCLEAHERGLTELVFGHDENTARAEMLYGGFLGGIVIGTTGIALHHQLCHVIGGLFDLPHAETNSVILPQALDYNRDFIPAANAVITGVFGGNSASRSVYDFAKRLGAPLGLKDIGMPAAGVDQVAQAMLAHGGYNPRPYDQSSLKDMLLKAFEGARPN